LIFVCDRFHVCSEWVLVHQQRQDITHKCLKVPYEWVLVHQQRQDVTHKCLNFLSHHRKFS
ncbi:hypothetical protein, partial [Fischerella thermalis]|uniref:hypothetical protein n=1 Tax=Fischerella thermalis TaxID=372787 RepID=UPI00241E59C8